MKHGDFTELAKYYVDRPGYSLTLLSYLKCYMEEILGRKLVVADIGAGTGKLTENLSEIGVEGYAVEPNDAMRAEGERLFSKNQSFQWSKGSAEATDLQDASVDWVLMGSSFHWADASKAIVEFKRILRTEGFFTAIWNPRDIAKSELHTRIEEMIYEKVPGMKRVSSGGNMTTDIMIEKLGDVFHDIVFMEAMHEEKMSKERYLNIWRSVNDIQVQAGEEGFRQIIKNIETILSDQDEIVVPYKSRAWTAQVK